MKIEIDEYREGVDVQIVRIYDDEGQLIRAHRFLYKWINDDEREKYDEDGKVVDYHAVLPYCDRKKLKELLAATTLTEERREYGKDGRFLRRVVTYRGAGGDALQMEFYDEQDALKYRTVAYFDKGHFVSERFYDAEGNEIESLW
ncbi:MAG: hypothetical protein JOZ52_09935 [Acidobacteria bacterium]|nr:hypothetical protein [Acidobacteriota bacterium]